MRRIYSISTVEKGSLYVCGTPIGNLSDTSERLISTLKDVSHIAAEDTRVTQILCQRFGIETPLISLQKFNEAKRISTITAWLDNGDDVALVSDAGTPTLSDPGTKLIAALHQNGHQVIPIPGPSAITALMSVSGIVADSFIFGGFFPRKAGVAKEFIDQASALSSPILFFESPQRIETTLIWIREHFPSVHIVIGKELTKKFEHIISGSIDTVLETLTHTPIKGEWCFIMSPPPQITHDVNEIVNDLKSKGLTLSQVLHIGQHYLKFSKNKLYDAYHVKK